MPQPPTDADALETKANLAAERHLQLGAALLLGFLLLVAVVLRAGIHEVFPPGWWRLW